MMVSFLSLCVHVDVVSGFVYSCWCRFCMYCIPFGVILEFVYSRWCHVEFGVSVFFANVHSGSVYPSWCHV